MGEEACRLTLDQARALGSESAGEFTWSFQRLISQGYYYEARCQILTAFVYVLACITPERRSALLSDISDMYLKIGKIAFEDSEDLYDFLLKSGENNG